MTENQPDNKERRHEKAKDKHRHYERVLSSKNLVHVPFKLCRETFPISHPQASSLSIPSSPLSPRTSRRYSKIGVLLLWAKLCTRSLPGNLGGTVFRRLPMGTRKGEHHKSILRDQFLPKSTKRQKGRVCRILLSSDKQSSMKMTRKKIVQKLIKPISKSEPETRFPSMSMATKWSNSATSGLLPSTTSTSIPAREATGKRTKIVGSKSTPIPDSPIKTRMLRMRTKGGFYPLSTILSMRKNLRKSWRSIEMKTRRFTGSADGSILMGQAHGEDATC